MHVKNYQVYEVHEGKGAGSPLLFRRIGDDFTKREANKIADGIRRNNGVKAAVYRGTEPRSLK